MLFFSFFSFSSTNISLPCQLHKANAVLWTSNRFVGSETSKHNDFDQFWKFKFYFKHFLRNTRLICIYLRTTDRHFRQQGNGRHPTSELLKCDLVQTLNNFRNPFCGFLLPGRLFSPRIGIMPRIIDSSKLFWVEKLSLCKTVYLKCRYAT